MSDVVKEFLKKIDSYDGSEENFCTLLVEALRFAQTVPGLADLQKQLAMACGPVAVSTVERWARSANQPGENVRQFILDELRDLLLNCP